MGFVAIGLTNTDTNGGEETHEIAEWTLNGDTIHVIQKTVRRNIRQQGLTLSDAKIACASSVNLKSLRLIRTNIATVWNQWDGVIGTTSRGTYTQIADSHLYEVNLETEEMSCSWDGGTTWVDLAKWVSDGNNGQYTIT